MFPMTKWVQRLLIANVVMFLLQGAVPLVYQGLVFISHPASLLYRPWTLVTYMFLHGGFGHLFFNMLGLFFFGPRLENKIGGKAFLWLYFLAGIGGALGQMAFATVAPMVGASGGVYAVLVGFAYYWPHETILLFPIPIPVPAWLLVTGYIMLSLYSGVTGSGAGVAHFAHLGGAAFGFGYLKWWEWRRGSAQRAFKKQLNPKAAGIGFVGDRIAVARWKGISVESLHELNREEVERLLAKVQEGGPATLTEAERDFLDRMSAS